MNPDEHALHYPWSEGPAPGTVTELRTGLYWLRMPLPFALDHINLWLLDDELDGRRGWTVIDCGIATEATQQAWETLFDQVFEGRPLLRVLATHFHPDHLGLADWLTQGGAKQRWRSPLWMSATDYLLGRLLSGMTGAAGDAAGERAATHFAANGLRDNTALSKVRARGAGYYPKLVPAVPTSFRRIVDGEVITIGPAQAKRAWRVQVGRGHAPEHVSLVCEADGLLISGDMVLPRISTNVSVFDTEPEGNPLPQYLHSLQDYLQLPADMLVLPSHGKPFVGLHARVAQQLAHHEARLADVLEACSEPMSAADAVPVLFKRELDLHQLTFALGEALAHLHALWYEGKLRRMRGDDGVYRFQRA